jgi:hypothetical protein
VEVFGEERAQFVAVLRSAAEEVFAGGQKFPVSFVVVIGENFLLEKLPKPLNQIQMRRIARQKMQLNLRLFQPFLHHTRLIIRRVVNDLVSGCFASRFLNKRIVDCEWIEPAKSVTVSSVSIVVHPGEQSDP